MPTSKSNYADIKEIVLARIRDHTWPPGAIIPGEVDLSQEFGCARATVNRAMRELAEDGILDRKRKAGTRVNKFPIRHAKFAIPLVKTEIEATDATYRYTLISKKSLTAPAWLRARLGLNDSAKVLHLQCLHFADNIPFQFEDRWINIEAVPNVKHADFTTGGPNEWLVKEVPFTDVEIAFSARIADKEIAEYLSLSIGDPVFTTERITWLAGNPITFARFSFGRGYSLKTRF
jgi:GntR family histidine utilization transcriptional repressor